MKQLFLIFAFLIGYSLTASAEKIKLVPSAGDSTRMDTVVISELSDADAYAPTDTHSNTNFSFFGDNMSNDMGGIIVLISVIMIFGLPLFIDGARLGYGVMADGSELTIPEIARLCDVFYIGGTKVGALFGEAVVIMNPALKKDFRFIMKQRGGRMAKGRLLGIQFDALFTDDLYFKISRHADEMAYQIRDIFVSAGYPLLFDSPTNQQYPIMPDDELAELGKNFGYEYWERVDKTHSGVRFCASWATTQEHVDALRAAVQALRK